VAGEEVLAENKLFATLDPTTRRLDLPDGQGGLVRLLITDTVGFIRALPPPLVEAFRSTLEETLDADQLLVVVDLSDPAWPQQLEAVNALLDTLGSTAPRQMVGNQIDRCDAQALELARTLHPTMLFVSATANFGLEGLRNWMITRVS
jgi:GTPase